MTDAPIVVPCNRNTRNRRYRRHYCRAGCRRLCRDRSGRGCCLGYPGRDAGTESTGPTYLPGINVFLALISRWLFLPFFAPSPGPFNGLGLYFLAATYVHQDTRARGIDRLPVASRPMLHFILVMVPIMTCSRRNCQQKPTRHGFNPRWFSINFSLDKRLRYYFEVRVNASLSVLTR